MGREIKTVCLREDGHDQSIQQLKRYEWVNKDEEKNSNAVNSYNTVFQKYGQ